MIVQRISKTSVTKNYLSAGHLYKRRGRIFKKKT